MTLHEAVQSGESELELLRIQLREAENKAWADKVSLQREIDRLKEQLEIKTTALADTESFRARENKESSIRLDTLLTVIAVAIKGK